jgi:hypothetical protein
LQENDLEKRMTATSGRKCFESFARFNHVGSWAKTFTGLLIGMEGWSSTRCRLIWKLKGTKYKRMFFQLRPSTLPTEGIGFGLWPTPTSVQRDHPERVAGLIEKGATTLMSRKNGENRPNSILDMAMFQGMLLTPTTREEVQDLDKFQKRMEKYPNGTKVPNLATQVVGMLPTPTTRDWKGGRTSEALEDAGRNETNSLPDFFAQPGESSQLNPLFVTEMMGYPTNWLELPFLNGETNL